MPIYEYVCQSCEHRFEVRQRFSDDPVSACSRCGQPVTKVISAPAIMFKGSGWYVTDYSDKLKAPESSDIASKPANGQGEQKNATSSGNDTAPSPSGGSSGSESSHNTNAASTSSSTAPTPSSGSTPTSAPGKTSD
ncbi:MAG TPA: FmdB family zinc ribbon protein [Nitrospiraceae bacterium]|nr:FmdB family zinc ribbon protein [Nitrospiraceae bacterium]